MLTSIPVMRRDRTMFDLPYDMNGRVSPVVGRRPIATPMWRNAVMTTVAVIPTAVS
jgi:hypothetical protein